MAMKSNPFCKLRTPLRVFATCITAFLCAICNASHPGPSSAREESKEAFWYLNSLMLAHVGAVHPHPGSVPSLDLEVLGVATGRLDPGETPIITFYFSYEYQDPPHTGDTIMAHVWRDAVEDGAFHAVEEGASFMTGWYRVLPNRATTDREFTDVTEKVRELRTGNKPVARPGLPFEPRRDDPTPTYWETHSVIYGEVRSTWDESVEKQTIAMDFRPRLKLSGPFDPALMPKLSVVADAKYLRPPFNQSPLGNALLFLSGDGEKYRVASELADFMPGDHAPICAVKDFDDPKVVDTLKRIQELRKKEKKKDAAAEKPAP